MSRPLRSMILISVVLSMFKITRYIYEVFYRHGVRETVPEPEDGKQRDSQPNDPEPRDPGNGSKLHGTNDITLARHFGPTVVEDWPGWEVDEKRPFEMLEHANSTSRWQCEGQCEELQWPSERAHHCSPWSRMPFWQMVMLACPTTLVMLAGRITLVYQVCMLTMSNFAITNGCSQGCDSWVIDGLQREVNQPVESPRRYADDFQSSTISKFTPEFMSRPSPYVFFTASMTWTLLEWAHYRSNPEHAYQSAILGVATILGLLPAVGCTTADMVPVLFCTVPWAIDLGLLVSDILHSAQPRDRD
jgi:hypothetical protein